MLSVLCHDLGKGCVIRGVNEVSYFSKKQFDRLSYWTWVISLSGRPLPKFFLEKKKNFIEEIYLNSSYNSRTFSPEQKRHTFGLFYFGIKPSIFLQFTIPQILYLLSIPALKIRIARFCGRQMCHIFQFSQLTWRQNPTMCWIMATIKAQPKMEKEMPNMWNHQHLSSKQLLAFSSSSAIAIFPREISCSCWCFSNTEEEKKSE